ENNPTLKRLIEAIKDMQKETKKGIKKQKFEAPSEWGPNYSEFKGDGLGAINKLLETKKGFVAGAFHKEGLGDIDLVWGNKDYGLEHILKRRIESYIKKGLEPKFAEQRALNLARMIPEAIEKGKVGRDAQGRLKIETKDILVALRDNWQGEPLKSRWVITGFEKKVGNLREQAKFIDPSLITKDGEHLASSLNSVGPNHNANALKKQEPLSEQANAKKLLKLEHAITPLKEFGTNYPEFALKPKEALEKLLQEKNGQVAGAAYREDLGGIDFVWGTPKTKESNGYGLAHILEKREKQYKRLGLTNEQAKERTKELLKQIPEVIEKGIKDNDYIGHATIRHNGIEVGLSSQKGNTPLKNHYMITSFEIDEKVLRELKTIGTLSNNYRDGINYSTSNLNNPNHNANALKKQEPLSEQANAKKLLKLESEKGIKRDYSDTKLRNDEIKELLNNAEIPTSGRDAITFGVNNLNPEIVEFLHKNNKKMIIEKASNKEIELLADANFRHHEDVRASLDHDAIAHILKRHGVNSVNVKNGERPITNEDIANYRSFIDKADALFVNNNNLIAFKQINGYAVVVEQAVNRKSELVLKTMFKSNGDYKDNNAYKKLQDTKPSKGNHRSSSYGDV
ncbi:DUF3519 domain-containing protein, partial [Helicobacter pylori]|uniref:DUF3519 domain-containing protein n=1 Tax=Helicobacter pylori TaxID=210 RepID=UPI00292806D3